MTKERAYTWSVTGLTIVLLGVLTQTSGPLPEVSKLLFWVIILLAVELLPVTLGFSTVTMGFPLYISISLLFAPLPAMLVMGLGAFDPREIRRTIAIHHALFNRAQLMLAVAGASAVFEPFRSSLGGDFLAVAVGAAGAAIVNTSINLVLVAMHIHTRDGVGFIEALKGPIPKPAAGFWTTYALFAGLGAATAVVYSSIRFGEVAVAFFLLPILFARFSIAGAKAQQELSEKIQEQQKKLLEATEQMLTEREGERRRIAGHIHDSALQLLAAASYGIANAHDLHQIGQGDQSTGLLATAKEAVDDAIKELRGSLQDLRKSSVEEGGLFETVKKFGEQASTLWGIEVRIEGEMSKEPPLPVALAGFQIIQEGLTNALKHAKNGAITVRILEEDGMVHLVVQDEGPGFDTEAEVGGDHVGMRLMRERAEQVGGVIQLDSDPGAGTRLEAILPAGVGS